MTRKLIMKQVLSQLKQVLMIVIISTCIILGFEVSNYAVNTTVEIASYFILFTVVVLAFSELYED